MARPTTMLVVLLLLAGCGGGSTPTSGDAVATVAPQPGNAVEDVPADEGVMAGSGEGRHDEADPAVAAAGEEAYLGRWIGVEGMYLNVARKPGGGVTLDMQWDLDSKGRFDGAMTAAGLRFTRGGVAETAVRTDGGATGLKWLAGRKDCLTVRSGEGYCRR